MESQDSTKPHPWTDQHSAGPEAAVILGCGMGCELFGSLKLTVASRNLALMPPLICVDHHVLIQFPWCSEGVGHSLHLAFPSQWPLPHSVHFCGRSLCIKYVS
jgi:hypothetical protein